MSESMPLITFLMAEDDSDDRLLIKEAFQESRMPYRLQFVNDGVELLNYLHRNGEFTNQEKFSTPDLILLDLNMPLKGGREALEEIKNDPNLKHMPVVVYTTSNVEEDILHSYNVGASGYIIKPVTYIGLTKAIEGLVEYWVQIVRLPSKEIQNE